MTEPQHMSALRDANQIRLRRARLRSEVAALNTCQGSGLLADMITDGYDTRPEVRSALATLAVKDAICWVQRLGDQASGRYLTLIGASETRRVKELTARQRVMLAGLLRGGTDALRDAEDNADVDRWARVHNNDPDHLGTAA